MSEGVLNQYRRSISTKKNVYILAIFSEDGKLTPVQITWKDGRKLVIDRFLKREKCASRKVDAAGTMYSCRMLRQDIYLFYEDDKWFVDEMTEHRAISNYREKLCNTIIQKDDRTGNTLPYSNP